MKNVLILVALIGLGISANAQSNSNVKETKENLRETKASMKANAKKNKLVVKEMQRKPTAEARKQAKRWTKAGYHVSPGGLPMAKQFENAIIMAASVDNKGLPEYICANERATGGTLNAAKMQAVHNAKVELAGSSESIVGALIKASVNNNQISKTQADTYDQALRASKEFIYGELTNTITVVEIFKDFPNGNTEVYVTLAYNSTLAVEATKRVVRKHLEEQTKGAHEELDLLMGWDNNVCSPCLFNE